MSLSQLRILHADDDQDTLDFVAVLLKFHDYEVVSAESHDRALMLAQTEPFSLYLIDNWLSGDSGIELCKKIREFDPLTPILFYSGAAYEGDKRRALECGAQSYLTKPVENEKLLAEIIRLVNQEPVAGSLSTTNLSD